MRIIARSVIALLLLGTTLVLGATPASGYGDEPYTSSIRIRLKGPTLRVRCRGGDCAINITHSGTSVTVSITRTQYGVPFNFTRTVENPTNIGIETGKGTDTVTVDDLSIPGFMRVFLGFGNDQLDLNGTHVPLKMSVDTGPGNDVLHLTSVIIGGKFRFASRDGNDTVSISGGHFLSRSGFDGGPGNDILAISGQPYPFPEPPDVRNFEQ